MTNTSVVEKEKISLFNVFLDLISFAMGLLIAWVLQWQTRDFIWSLWVSSLVLGYISIISAISGMSFGAIYPTLKPEFKTNPGLKSFLMSAGVTIFLLGFFTFHFCGFHAGHAIFLSQFFPLENIPRDAFSDTFTSPLKLAKIVFENFIMPYGFFLVPVIISERHHIFRPFKSVGNLKPAHISSSLTQEQIKEEETNRLGEQFGMAMVRPYINVVRMHLLIFFFAFCYFLKIHSFIIYATVYFVYFFPWQEAKKFRKQSL